MRLVYAVRLDLAAEIDPDPVWDSVVDWIRRRDRPAEALAAIDSALASTRWHDWHDLSAAERLRFACPDPLDGWQVREAQWQHPDAEDPTILWNPESTLLSGPDGHSLFLTLRTGSIEFTIAPGRHGLGTPRLVRDLVRDLAPRMRGWPLTPTVSPLSVENVTTLLSELKSPQRTIPYVVVTRSDVSDGITDQLGLRLTGLARVFQTTDKWAEFALGDDLGQSFRCFNGAVRIYWPGLDSTADPWNHPLYLRDRIGDIARFSHTVFRRIANVAAFRHSEPPELTRLRSAIRDRELSELRHRAEASQDINDFLEETVKIEQERNDLRDQVRELEDRLAVAQGNAEAAWAYRRDLETTGDDASDQTDPQTVREAVELAKERFSNLEFLPSAHDSAQDSRYANPSKVFHALQAIDEVASVWIDSLNTGQSTRKGWRDEFVERGFDYASGSSQVTAGRYPDEHYFTYEGRREMFPEHLRLGTSHNSSESLRIHFKKDDRRRKVVIAHVGEHLRTGAT